MHTGQRTAERGSTRAAGAPDCPVNPERGDFEIFTIFLSNFEPNQIPTYKHTKEYLLG
jgi:hypothetical protein